MSAGYGASFKDKGIVLRCLNVVGRRDHFGHFFFDFLLPFYHWLYTHGRLYDENLTVYFADRNIEAFRSVIKEMFYCRVVTAFTGEQVRGCHREMIMGMEGHNRRVLNLSLLDYIGNPCAYQQDLRNYAIKRLNLENTPPDTLILIERKMEKDDRGGRRRNISNHEELRNALKVLADEEGLIFQNTVLEDMTFREQVRLFLRASIVVGQHGAGLCHILWMMPVGILVELSTDNSQAYRFGQFCNFFRNIQHFPTICQKNEKATNVVQESILVPVPQLLDTLRQKIRRRKP